LYVYNKHIDASNTKHVVTMSFNGTIMALQKTVNVRQGAWNGFIP